MGNQKLVFSIFAITLGMMLLGSVLTNSTPLVFADDHEDKKKKLKELLKKLKAKIKKHQDDDDDKCKEKKKYQGECDLERPEVEIEEPENGDKLPAGLVTFELKAKDKGSGLAKVQLRINDGPFLDATLISGDKWEFVADLEPGKYKATAKATDNVGNKSRDTIKFRVK